MHVVAWVALISGNEKLRRYQLMQCIKESSTRRVSRKREKSSPRVVFRFGKQDREIRRFLARRKLIKKIDKDRNLARLSLCKKLKY